MKAKYADRLRRINDKKKANILKKKDAREPDFIVVENKKAARPVKEEKPKKKPKSLTNCPPEFAFFLANGGKVNNLHELANQLEEMPDEVFDHHVNEEKNDFSNWVNDVVQENELAEDLKKSKDKKDHHVKVLKHVAKEVTNYIQ